MSHALPKNTRLQGGKITIQAVLGEGGFGITYKAEHEFQGALAVKEMFISGQNKFCTRNDVTHRVQPNIALQADYEYFKKQFKDEAKTLNKFRNIAGIVNVLDIFEENDTIYIVMQYVEGRSLKQLVAEGGKLSVADALHYAAQLCNALDAIHTENVIHRDIAPDNILITPQGNAVLIDFGIARSFIDGKTITHTNFTKLGYSAPEQEVQRAQRGAYTDIYSLAGTLYYCLTGIRPPTAAERGIEGYTPIQEHNAIIPAALGQAIDKALEIKPIDRYPSALAFSAALIGKNGTVLQTQLDDKTQVDIDTRQTAEEKAAKEKQAAAQENTAKMNQAAKSAFLAAARTDTDINGYTETIATLKNILQQYPNAAVIGEVKAALSRNEAALKVLKEKA